MTSTGFQIKRHHKVQKAIAAFDDDDASDDEADARTAGPGGGSSSAAQAAAAAAANWEQKGAQFATAGDWAAALRCWDQAVLVRPQDARLHEMRAQVLNEAGRTFEALEAAARAAALAPDWPEAHITLARVQLNLGEPQLALGSYQAAASLAQPDHAGLAEELLAAQMYAKRHQQQAPGTRAHVTTQQAGARTADGLAAPGDGSAAAAAAAPALEDAGAAGTQLVDPAVAAGAEGRRQRIRETEVAGGSDGVEVVGESLM